jgi:3-phenylpropionate/trans-cinnamate dioxygenase ferredoxin component
MSATGRRVGSLTVSPGGVGLVAHRGRVRRGDRHDLGRMERPDGGNGRLTRPTEQQYCVQMTYDIRCLGGTNVHRLAALADLKQLEPVLVTVADEQVAVVRVGDEVFAFAPTCTHRAAPMANGAVTWKRTILCPWHLGTFSLRTGEPKAGPPGQPLPCYPVTVTDGTAYLAAAPSEQA